MNLCAIGTCGHLLCEACFKVEVLLCNALKCHVCGDRYFWAMRCIPGITLGQVMIPGVFHICDITTFVRELKRSVVEFNVSMWSGVLTMVETQLKQLPSTEEEALLECLVALFKLFEEPVPANEDFLVVALDLVKRWSRTHHKPGSNFTAYTWLVFSELLETHLQSPRVAAGALAMMRQCSDTGCHWEVTGGCVRAIGKVLELYADTFVLARDALEILTGDLRKKCTLTGLFTLRLCAYIEKSRNSELLMCAAFDLCEDAWRDFGEPLSVACETTRQMKREFIWFLVQLVTSEFADIAYRRNALGVLLNMSKQKSFDSDLTDSLPRLFDHCHFMGDGDVLWLFALVKRALKHEVSAKAPAVDTVARLVKAMPLCPTDEETQTFAKCVVLLLEPLCELEDERVLAQIRGVADLVVPHICKALSRDSIESWRTRACMKVLLLLSAKGGPALVQGCTAHLLEALTHRPLSIVKGPRGNSVQLYATWLLRDLSETPFPVQVMLRHKGLWVLSQCLMDATPHQLSYMLIPIITVVYNLCRAANAETPRCGVLLEANELLKTVECLWTTIEKVFTESWFIRIETGKEDGTWLWPFVKTLELFVFARKAVDITVDVLEPPVSTHSTCAAVRDILRKFEPWATKKITNTQLLVECARLLCECVLYTTDRGWDSSGRITACGWMNVYADVPDNVHLFWMVVDLLSAKEFKVSKVADSGVKRVLQIGRVVAWVEEVLATYSRQCRINLFRALGVLQTLCVEQIWVVPPIATGVTFVTPTTTGALEHASAAAPTLITKIMVMNVLLLRKARTAVLSVLRAGEKDRHVVAECLSCFYYFRSETLELVTHMHPEDVCVVARVFSRVLRDACYSEETIAKHASACIDLLFWSVCNKVFPEDLRSGVTETIMNAIEKYPVECVCNRGAKCLRMLFGESRAGNPVSVVSVEGDTAESAGTGSGHAEFVNAEDTSAVAEDSSEEKPSPTSHKTRPDKRVRTE